MINCHPVVDFRHAPDETVENALQQVTRARLAANDKSPKQL
jgi:hypothetical protein